MCLKILSQLMHMWFQRAIQLLYETTNQQEKNKLKRKRIWFNPPYSINVKTKLGKTLKLVTNKFHNKHSFHEIFNKNTLKISYSCTKNMASIISSHLPVHKTE